MTSTPRLVAAALLVAGIAACSTSTPSATPGPGSSGGPSGGPSGSPTGAPSPSSPTGLVHPTGEGDIVLRFEEGGGLMPVEASVTHAPSFTLYGDGTVVFRDPSAPPPESNDGVFRSNPFLTVRLDEDGIQALLNDALGPGRLAVAAEMYMAEAADVGTATFTLAVGGATKQVTVVGLAPEMHPQDQAIITEIAAFADRLRTFGDRIAGERPYAPPAYRGTLISVDQPFGPVIDWPWTDILPVDFGGGENDFFRTHVLTPAQIETLGIEGVTGGMTGVVLDSNGKLFSFSLRPLLPDETE